MSKWIELFFTYDEIEAQIVKDVLELENIEVVTKSLKISPYPVNIGRMGEVRLFVKEEDFDRAMNAINRNDIQGVNINDR